MKIGGFFLPFAEIKGERNDLFMKNKRIWYGIIAIFLSLILYTVVSYFITKMKRTDYISAFIGGAGSILGGLLTLAGVWWTITRQNNDKFIDEFPRKIKELDSITEHLRSICEEEKEHILFKAFYNNQPQEPLIFDQAFDGFIDRSIYIDGIVYREFQSLKALYKKGLEEARTHWGERELKSDDQFNGPVYGFPTEATNKIDLIYLKVHKSFKATLNRIEKHKKNMEDRYFH